MKGADVLDDANQRKSNWKRFDFFDQKVFVRFEQYAGFAYPDGSLNWSAVYRANIIGLMKLLVVDNGTSYLQALLKLMDQHEIKVISWIELSKIDTQPVDAIVISGGHSLAVIEHDEEFKNELELIRRTELPIIGICLGFELIAHAYGATLRRLKTKEKGLVQLKVVQPHPILLGISEANVYESHRWIVERVPKPLVGLAASKDGYEIITHESKPIFGFQFHPEMFQDVTVGDEIMKNCLRYIKECRW